MKASKFLVLLLIGALTPWGAVFGQEGSHVRLRPMREVSTREFRGIGSRQPLLAQASETKAAGEPEERWQVFSPQGNTVAESTEESSTDESLSDDSGESILFRAVDRWRTKGVSRKDLPVDMRGRIQVLAMYGSWEDDSHGTWQGGKVVLNTFGHDRHVYGITAKYTEYKGAKREQSKQRFMYNGKEYWIGPSYEYRHFGGKFGINLGGTLGSIFIENNGRRDDYRKDEEHNLVGGEFYLYLLRRGDPLFKTLSLESTFREELRGRMQHNSWEDDAPGSRTYREAKLRAHTKRFFKETVSFNVGVKAGYEHDRHFLWEGGVFGITVLDSFYFEYEYLHGQSNAPDKWSVSGGVDLFRAFQDLRSWRSGSSDSDEHWVVQ